MVISILGPGRSFEAEDVTQEIFIKIFRNLPNYNVESKFGTWLYRIAYNTAVDFRRRAKYHLSFLDEDFISKMIAVNGEGDPYNIAIDREKQMIILVSMQELPDIIRSALYLFYWLGHSIHEVAEVLGAKPETVKSYLHRGRQQLHTKLKKRGIAHE